MIRRLAFLGWSIGAIVSVWSAATPNWPWYASVYAGVGAVVAFAVWSRT